MEAEEKNGTSEREMRLEPTIGINHGGFLSIEHCNQWELCIKLSGNLTSKIMSCVPWV